MRAMLSHPFLQSNRKPEPFSSEILAHASLVTARAGAGYRNGLAVVCSRLGYLQIWARAINPWVVGLSLQRGRHELGPRRETELVLDRPIGRFRADASCSPTY